MCPGPDLHYRASAHISQEEPNYEMSDIPALRQVAWDLRKVNPDLADRAESRIKTIQLNLIGDMERDLRASERHLESLKNEEGIDGRRFLRTRILLFARKILNGDYNV